MFKVKISIKPASSDTLALVQWVKKGNPSVSTARCLLIPFVDLEKQNPFDSILALQVFFTACESIIINVVHLAFFLAVHALAHVTPSSALLCLPVFATACNANIQWNRVASLWVSLANCSHFLVDRKFHLRFLFLSS